MNELIFAAAAVTAGTAVAILAAQRLRHLRSERDAWERNYRAECRRHDAAFAQWHAETKRLRAEQSAAAAQIWTLATALADATAQVEAGRGQVAIVESVEDAVGLLNRVTEVTR